MDAAREHLERGARRLGYPWDRLWEAKFAALEAQRAAELALEAGDDRGRAAAAFDLESALLQEKARRGDVADALLLMLSCATEERFTDLWGAVMAFAVRADWRKAAERFFSTQPGGTTWAVELEKRVREQDAAIAKLKAENWELANWIARLEREQESHTTGGPEHGTGIEGEGPIVVAPDTGGRDGRREAV